MVKQAFQIQTIPKGCFIDKDTDFVYFNDINEELIQSDNHERICYDSKDYLEDQILLYVDGTISKTNDDLTIDGSNGPNSLEVNDKLTPPGIEINLHHNETIFEEIITGEKIDQTYGPSPYKINNSDGDLLFPSDVITSDDKIEYCRNIVTDNSNNYVGFSYLGSSSGDEECQLFENDYLDTTNGVPFTTSESNSETRYYNVGTNDEHLLKYKNTTSTSSTIESTQPITYTSGITGSDHPQYDWNNMIVKPTKHHKCYKKNSTTEKLHTQSPLCYGIDSNEVDSNSNYYSILNNSCGGDFMIPDDEECEKAVSILYPEAVYDSSNAVVTGSCIVTIPDKDGILDGDIYPKWTYGSTPPVGTDYYSLCKKSTSDNFGSSESHNTHLTWKMFTEDISLPSCGDCNEELVTTTSDTNSNYNKLEDVCNGYNTQCVFRGGSAETQCYDTNSIPQDESTLLKSQSNCSLGSDVELESISVNTGSSGEGYNFVGTLSTTSTTTIGDYLETIDKSNQLVYTGRNIGNTIYINIFDKTGNLITDPTDPAVTNVPINMNRYSSDCLIYDPYGTLPDKIDLDFSEVRPGWINPNISVVDNTDSTSGLNIYETTLGWGSIDPSNFGTKGCGPKWIEGQWRKVTFDANTNIINEEPLSHESRKIGVQPLSPDNSPTIWENLIPKVWEDGGINDIPDCSGSTMDYCNPPKEVGFGYSSIVNNFDSIRPWEGEREANPEYKYWKLYGHNPATNPLTISRDGSTSPSSSDIRGKDCEHLRTKDIANSNETDYNTELTSYKNVIDCRYGWNETKMSPDINYSPITGNTWDPNTSTCTDSTISNRPTCLGLSQLNDTLDSLTWSNTPSTCDTGECYCFGVGRLDQQ